jgi:hypothetical protein
MAALTGWKGQRFSNASKGNTDALPAMPTVHMTS